MRISRPIKGDFGYTETWRPRRSCSFPCFSRCCVSAPPRACCQSRINAILANRFRYSGSGLPCSQILHAIPKAVDNIRTACPAVPHQGQGVRVVRRAWTQFWTQTPRDQVSQAGTEQSPRPRRPRTRQHFEIRRYGAGLRRDILSNRRIRDQPHVILPRCSVVGSSSRNVPLSAAALVQRPNLVTSRPYSHLPAPLVRKVVEVYLAHKLVLGRNGF